MQLTGSTVIIVGRREEKLREAQEAYPGLHIRVCNIPKEDEAECELHHH